LTIITVTLNTSVDRTLEVPGFAPGAHLKGRLVRLQPGGKGVNVSRCLAALGVPSVMTGLVGRDQATLFRQSFAAHPVRVELVPTDRPTRTCTTILDPASATDTHVREQGQAAAPADLAALGSKLEDLVGQDDLVAFCGSLPPGLESGAVAALAERVRRLGAGIAADLAGSALRAVLPQHPLLIKPNVEELGECLGRDLAGVTEDELLAAAGSLCDRAEAVLVTRGRDGALAVRQAEALAARVDVVAPRNTVGCGDAFLAGYLAAHWRGEGHEQALRRAVACGAAQAMADAPGLLDRQTVEALAASAVLRRLR